uniref:Uncharacterized protein n=1 Tax=Spironucleus salmonicida TaxID=348837 RepID=V6LLH2_9EUKA|eukprot:EST45510.1 Hypothetical protein SS50377_14582 [Spironucleus salmonicida]
MSSQRLGLLSCCRFRQQYLNFTCACDSAGKYAPWMSRHCSPWACTAYMSVAFSLASHLWFRIFRRLNLAVLLIQIEIFE